MAVIGVPKESNQMSLAFESRAFDKKEGHGGRIGCTLVTGFLGCGKTTLLQHILKSRGNLQIAVLVNEFGEIDIDSLLLDSSRINASHGLSSVSLADGCACCSTIGKLKEAVRRTIHGNHNFDYVVIETSGLANPFAIAKELEETGIRLDLVVTVVDVETIDTILSIPVAKQQLEMADIVLINKCDLASLATISDVEDRVEEATKGTKAVRCRFSNVSLDLVLNVAMPDLAPSLATTTANSAAGFLSHEAVTPTFRKDVVSSSFIRAEDKNSKTAQRSKLTDSTILHEHDVKTVSVMFSMEAPMSMAAFQDFVVSNLQSAKSLLRAKGVVWFQESRSTRNFFHFSGKRRSEATYAGLWDSQAHTDVVFIGRDKGELELLRVALSKTVVSSEQSSNSTASLEAITVAVKEFERLMSSDTRFKVHGVRSERSADSWSTGKGVQSMVIFGLVGASLRGVHEGDLNASLMQTVNNRGVIFLTSGSSLKEGGWLQLCFGGDLTPDGAWCEIKGATAGVIAKAFRDICPCRCDMVPQMHSDHI